MKQQYLITTTDGDDPYFTDWYTHENVFDSEKGMQVFDLVNDKYTFDGVKWCTIQEDHL